MVIGPHSLPSILPISPSILIKNKKIEIQPMPTKRIQTGITRFDITERGTLGYMVRISRGGEKHNRFFSDKEYGGKRKALTAAKNHYDELVASLPPAKTSKGILSARNKSGRVGVHLAVNPSSCWSDVEYSSYVASWKNEEGRRQKISFSVEKYGKRKARDYAIIAREHEITDRKRIEQLFESKSNKKNSSKKKRVKKKASRKVSR